MILDVVFNHTREGNHYGSDDLVPRHRQPDLLHAHRPAGPTRPLLHDFSGCGNTLDFNSPAVIRLVMDSLRYWVQHMHVDGFRFDLASVFGRTGQGEGFASNAPFFDALLQDPVLGGLILVAEPWDTGTYRVGNFPVDWSEWNGTIPRHRCVASKGDGGQLPDLATGSPDRPTSTVTTAARHTTASISSPVMTASPCTISSPMTTSTMTPTVRTIATAPTTTIPGTAGPRATPTTGRSWHCVDNLSKTTSANCFSPAVRRCYWAVTSSCAPREATTTPTVRTTRSPGSTGRCPKATAMSSNS